MPWPPFNRDDLRAAASSAGFDMILPILIRRLIAETAADLVDLDMPGESGVAAGGFDGVARARLATAHVPDGVSVWELSVGGNDAKANDDYSKRSAGPPGFNARDSTYVQVILAPWTKARTWASEKNKVGSWREVRAYNLDRVHLWLESAPATTAWLAAKLGRAMPGVRALQEWWTDTWIPSTDPSLGADIVLAGRAESSQSFVEKLFTGARVVSLGGQLRLEEAMAFIAAALSSSSDEGAETLLARTLVVSDGNSLERLVAQRSPLVIVLSDLSLARELPATHPHQLIVLAPPGDLTSLEVERVSSNAVAALLDGQTNPVDLGYLARRSLLALRRKLALVPGLFTPAWATAPDSTVRRLLLLGSWRSEQAGDRAVVEALVQDNYGNVSSRAEALRTGDDMPFLEVVQDEWYVVAREDAWSLLAQLISTDDLRAVEEAVIGVFQAVDPVLALDPDERWKATLNGVSRPHSLAMRKGLAEYIAIAGASTAVVAGTPNRHSDFARILARRIFQAANADATYQLWTSLSDVVGLLAEGAPDEFLAAMRAGLVGGDPLHRQMFQDSTRNGGIFGPSSPHSAFLWALERLAWSPDYVEDVVRILVALDAIDPGGELSNRPRASLLGILSVWRPQTSALLEQRLRAVDIVADRSDHALESLLGLIPRGRPWQMDHPAPRFRDWRVERPTTNGDIRAALDHISAALARLEVSPELALAVVPRLEDLGTSFREQFVMKVSGIFDSWAPEDVVAVFEAVRDFVARHLEHSDAAWALSPEHLAPLQTLRDSLEPSDLVLKHRWLFKEAWITLGDVSVRDDYEEFGKELASRRRAAVESLYSSRGLAGVIELAEQADPWLVGLSLGNAGAPAERDLLALLPTTSTSVSSLAAGYFSTRLQQADCPVEPLLDEFPTAQQQAFLLRYLPDQKIAQDRLEGLDDEVANIYWRNFSYYGLGADYSEALATGWNLLDADRPVAAIMLNILYLRDSLPNEETADLFAAALEALLKRTDPDPEIQSLGQYELERVFSVLATHRQHLGAQRVVSLEWQLLPLSTLDANAPALHAEIAANPQFFVELITACFKSSAEASGESEEPEDEEDAASREGRTEQQRSVAGRAWEVLHSCDQVPGVNEDGSFDANRLREWIAAARTGLAAVDRTEIGDLQIGELLSHAPRNDDGSPLPREMRDVVEQTASDEIVRGIAVGLRNSRGIFSRDLTAGGTQEWQLAESYRSYAGNASSWPLVRRMFEGIAESYEADARREDMSAERRRQGLR